MAIFKTKGIVFRTLKYSESSIIADIFTRERGMRSYIISGIRSSKSKMKAGLFQLMTMLDMVAYDKGNDKLARIKELHLAHHYKELPFNVIKSSIGIFMLEVCRNVIIEKEANEELYDFLEGWFMYIDDTQLPINNHHLLFLLELSAYIGFRPEHNYKEGYHLDLMEGTFVSIPISAYFLDATLSRSFHKLLHTDRASVNNLNIPSPTRRALLESLITYYKLHVDQFKEIKSLSVITTILH
jgi:DNA repair protein RecO (recombination protein O)